MEETRNIVPNVLDLIFTNELADIHTAVLKTTNITKANLLRRSILRQIETYAIDVVIFEVNTSSRHDEIIALRLGQLVIDHTRFIPPEDGKNLTVNINVGEGEFSTDDINLEEGVSTGETRKLPFKFRTPIAILRKGQRIVCKCIIVKGTAQTHVKWRPVSKVIIKEKQQHIELTIKGIGMMKPEDIFREGYGKLQQEAKVPPQNIFFRPIIPADIADAIKIIQEQES